MSSMVAVVAGLALLAVGGGLTGRVADVDRDDDRASSSVPQLYWLLVGAALMLAGVVVLGWVAFSMV